MLHVVWQVNGVPEDNNPSHYVQGKQCRFLYLQAVILLGGEVRLADKLTEKWPLLMQPPEKTVLLPEVSIPSLCLLEDQCEARVFMTFS